MHIPLHHLHQNAYASIAANASIAFISDASMAANASAYQLQRHAYSLASTSHTVHLNGAFKALKTMQDPSQCTIMGDAFDYAIQILLFGICMGSLLLKWHIERPQRRLLVFFMDISKQLVSATLFHLINMVFAVIVPTIIDDLTDECSWYWVNLMFDNTFGLTITYLLVRGSERVCGYQSGMYGEEGVQIDWENKPDYNGWVRQIFIYCFITMGAKAMSMTIVLLRASVFASIGSWGTHWVANGSLRLLWVMIVTPAIMNTFYFWTADEFLRHDIPESPEPMKPSVKAG